jgi:glycerol uptake facilitator-like aquaporin
MPRAERSKRTVAEALGAAMLSAAVVGSGIMAERLAAGNDAIALLANAVATGAVLVALISALGPHSSAHFNPAVTFVDAFRGGVRWRDVPTYVVAQGGGAFVGVAVAHLMFSEPIFTASTRVRSGGPQFYSEFVATFGLIAVIVGSGRHSSTAGAIAVGAYITGAYWFTASTSFANPALTFARAATDTFTGVRPADLPSFVIAQMLGAGAAATLFRWVLPIPPKPVAEET